MMESGGTGGGAGGGNLKTKKEENMKTKTIEELFGLPLPLILILLGLAMLDEKIKFVVDGDSDENTDVKVEA